MRVRQIGGWCKHSHKLTAENSYVTKDGYIHCRVCRRLSKSRNDKMRRYLWRLHMDTPRLRAKLRAAHPDTGTKLHQFDRVLKLYQQVRRELGR